MIKKRTRPQTRVRNPSPDPSDSAPTDSQQEKSEQNQDQDEGDLPYAFVHSAIRAVSPNVHTSATVSPNSSSSANFVVHDKGLMHPS